MVKSLIAGRRPAKRRPTAARTPSRPFTPEEFEADTQEDRSIAVLADKRRAFLTRRHTPHQEN